MRRRRNTAPQLGEHSIFGDERAAQLHAELDELRAAVADLSGRLHAQFTTIAAHAEIARQQSEFVRDEARADVDRTRDTLIDLIERLRDQTTRADHHVPGTPPGPSNAAIAERFEAIEARLGHIADAVETSLARQRELVDTVAAVLDTVLAESRSRPIEGLSLT